MQILTPNNIIQNKINFGTNKSKTIAILGSSKSTEEIMEYMDTCANVTKGIILTKNNVIHGCGNSGIMGVTYKTAAKNSAIDEQGKPLQNLAIVMEPRWGDEDLENCVPVAFSNSEAQRIEQFREFADKFVVFPGSATTLQEVTSLIAKNYYGKPEDKKEIILVGRDFFKGLSEQYQKLYEAKLIKNYPDELFKIIDDSDAILKEILGQGKAF